VNATWGIYIKCLETGERLAIHADEPMDTMSVIKIPLMVEVFHQVEAGKFKLTDRVLVRDSDKRPGTGVLQSLDQGMVPTIRDLITLMIVVSDNSATDLLFAKVGGIKPVNDLMRSYGLNTIQATGLSKAWFEALHMAPSALEFHKEGKHPFGLSSAHDMGLLLEKIAKGEAVSNLASSQMLEIMRGQVYNTRLPKYVAGFRVPHKTGDFLPYIANDVGILESPNRNVVISVFTAHHEGIGANLEDAVARVAEQAANYFSYRESAPAARSSQ
jgi:beta-lactamase class A